MFTLDADGAVCGWSASAQALLGYAPDEFLGRDVSVLWPPEAAQAGFGDWQLQQARQTGMALERGWRLRRDQARVWTSMMITPLQVVAGHAARFTVIVWDETRPQQRLQRSDQRFADVFAVSPVGIAVLDAQGWLIEANAALAGLLGCELAELYARGINTLLAGEDGGAPILPASTDTDTHVSRQRILDHHNGQGVVHCDLHVAVSHGNEGQPFWLVAFHDITERHQHAEQQYQATHDELTGLANRRAVLELLDRLLAPDGSAGPAGRVGVLFCDVDHFKRINDALGHQAGDQVLTALAQRLQTGLPAGCVPARQAGDEFLIVCPDVDTVAGMQPLIETVAALLRTRLHIQGQTLQVSASVGAAVLGHRPASAADLVRFADAAMFEAKIRGPGQFHTADQALQDSTDRSLALEHELRQALAGNELALHYQPIVAADGHIRAVEALVRWPHPQRGMLGPGMFLPVARRAGLLDDLDQWVLATAVHEVARWPDATGHAPEIAINLDAFTPGQRQFTTTVTEILTAFGIAAERVVLELTETALLDSPHQPHQAMHELATRGLRFAVDDFGTGYSSLTRLTDLPVQIIKIDRAFVAGLPEDTSCHAVIHAVTNLARTLGRDCIAEGVETPDEFHALTSSAPTGYQGWLFSPALPTTQLRELLTQPTPQLPPPQPNAPLRP